MNLAPIRYARAESAHGGPINRIETGRILIGGVAYYQVNTWLSDQLGLSSSPLEIFSMASGSGTDRSALLARYKGISEALERWAYQSLVESVHAGAYGFDMEPSTSGMAAFPGLFGWQSRKRAMREAIERWCVLNWWEGRLGWERDSDGAINILWIENPISSDPVILTWKCYEGELYAYGTASAGTSKAACHQSVIEMERSAAALLHYRKRNPVPSIESVRAVRSYGERQILFYSMPEGHALFQERLGKGTTQWRGKRPAPVVDCVIPGPWQEYATVWRVLYPMETEQRDNSPESHFLY